MDGKITQPIRQLRRSQDITVRCLPPQRARERTPDGVHSLEVLAFGDFVHVTGSLPLWSRHKNPVQYRLLIGESQVGGPISSDCADRVVGICHPAGILLTPTLVGRLERRLPFRSTDVVISSDDVDECGWIDLVGVARDRAARSRYLSRFLADGEFERLRWRPDGALATIDISGVSDDVECLVVRLEVRELLDREIGSSRPMQGNGRTGLVRVDAAARSADTGHKPQPLPAVTSPSDLFAAAL